MITKYIRNTASYDSHLYTDDMNRFTNARFQIWLRVCLQQGATGATAAPGNIASTAFTTAEWTNLKNQFRSQAQSFWTGNYWLIPLDPYPELQIPPSAGVNKIYQCNAYCELFVRIQDSAADAHRVVNFYKVPAANEAGFGTNSANMSAGDISERTRIPTKHNDSAGNAQYCNGGQPTLAHEVGHLLGLDHIGVYKGTTFTDSSGTSHTCVAANQSTQSSTVANPCYQALTLTDTCSIMGLGSGLSLTEGLPWHDRISQHTGMPKGRWELKRQRVAPKPL